MIVCNQKVENTLRLENKENLMSQTNKQVVKNVLGKPIISILYREVNRNVVWAVVIVV